jgi:acid stress chaperone HdeA
MMRANLPTTTLVPTIVAAAATITLAAEFQKPVTQWTCAEFLSIDDEFKATVVHSAMAHAKSGQAAVGDINDIEKVIPQIIGECTKAPQATFWARLKDEWKKIGAETGGWDFQR